MEENILLISTIILSVMALYGYWLISMKDPTGFIVWIYSNIGWAFIDFWKGIPVQGALFVIYIIICIYGYCNWTKKTGL